MRLKFYDFETYPEWWCVVFSDEEESYKSRPHLNLFDKEEEVKIKGKMRVYHSDEGREGLNRLKRDIASGVLTGYNNKRFDQIILWCVANEFTPEQVYIAAMLLINSKKEDELAKLYAEYPDARKVAQYIRRKFNGEAFQDLMDDSSQKGLKDGEAALGLDIRETTVPFGKKNLTQDEKDQIIFYCLHDVYALHVRYMTVSKPYIDTKISLCKQYDIPLKVGYENTNAVLAGKVLGARRYPGTTITDPTITIYQEELRKYFEKWVPSELYNHLLTSQEKKKMKLFGNTVDTGDGGLHSVYITPKVGRKNSVLYVEATEEFGLWNVDASSCYPATMIFAGAMPRGITKPERFVKIYETRLALKERPKSSYTQQEKEKKPRA